MITRVGEAWHKVHASPRTFTQELAAYERVAPRLAEAGFRVPHLLDADARRRRLVVSHVEGEPAIGVADRRDLHRQVGRLVATLRDLPCPSADELPLSDAIVRRRDAWIERARPSLPSAVLEQARDAIGDGSAFVGVGRTWCHRDLGPHNWLVADGILGVVDFEHTTADVWHVDLLKLADADWLADPPTRDAFFTGRGAPLDANDADRLERLLWLHALATTTWATQHGDAGLRAHGQRLLDQLARARASRISSADPKRASGA